MRKTLSGSMLLMTFLVAVAMPTVSRGTDMEQMADQLWNDREDLGKAAEAIGAYEALWKDKPHEYEILLRLSRLHYWVGQNLEATDRENALSHYGKGKEYGKRASEIAPEKPGGYFFAEAYVKDGRNYLATKELEAAAALPDSALPDAVPEQRMEKKRAAELLKRIGK